MCGIFGIVGAVPGPEGTRRLGAVLAEAAGRLAYRGYDSVGVATVAADGTIDLRKDVGKVPDVAARLGFDGMDGRRGITQLRWATFGAPSIPNAQPHIDSGGALVGAHNGNVVNNAELRRQFVAEGMTVRGTNDGESCVHAVERHRRRGLGLVEAVRAACGDLAGDFAFVVSDRESDRLVAVKKGSGLVLGLGDGFTCCSSDLPSILPLTRRVIPVEDGEMAVLSPGGAELYRVSDGERIAREPRTATEDVASSEKGGYPHFMLKEIHQQPEMARDLLHLLAASEYVPRIADALRSAGRVFLVGSGSSYNACVVASAWFARLAGILAIPVLPQQFSGQFGGALRPGDVALYVSQSGETKDVLNAVEFARERGVRGLALLNVLGSTLTRKVEAYLPLACDREVSVPATKTFTNQVLALVALAARSGRPRPEAREALASLEQAPLWLERTIAASDGPMAVLASDLSGGDRLFVLGFGTGHGIALEGALKCKEVTGMPCEGMLSTEFKHGPLAMVDRGTPVVFTAPPSGATMLVNAVTEVTCRHGNAVVVAPDHPMLVAEASLFVPLPIESDLEFAIAGAVPLQLLAYRLAVARGMDPDYPRNLSKTLTVD